MNTTILSILLVSLACMTHVLSFMAVKMTRSLPLSMSIVPDQLESIVSSTPDDEKSRARFKMSGDLLGTAIFRAELKKELTFFYGCGAEFITPLDGKNDRAELICEGKTSKIVRFCKGWLKTMQSPLNTRKVSFQGPQLLVHVEDAQWDAYTGNVKGFTTVVPPPPLLGKDKIPEGEKVYETTRMAGTDESV